jgi:V/A-type H+-transporting ATPase subunit I
MIVPMKRVSLVIQHKAQIDALTKLRELGVMHLERKSVSSDSLSALFERKAAIETAQGLIQPYKAPKKNPAANKEWQDRKVVTGHNRGRRATDIYGDENSEFYSMDAINAPVRPDLVELLVSLGKELKTCQDRLAVLSREQTRLKNWGNFDPESIRTLAEKGVRIYLYELTPAVFANIPEDIDYIVKNQDKDLVRIIAFDKEIPGVNPLGMPEKSLSRLDAEAAELPVKIKEIEKKLERFASRKPVLKKEMDFVQHQIEFEAARASLEKVEDVPEDLAVSWFSGFVPQEDVGKLKRAAVENNWALVADDPGPEDEVPTKLKNGKFASLIYPLTDFLEVVPGYNEVDISGWFLFFFCIFFGMIFGDAAYGAIFLLAGIICILKTAKKGVPPAFKLLFLLGLSNFVWGVLTCTWFGVEVNKLPQFLRDLSLPLISNVTAGRSLRDEGIVRQNLMIFCFSLAFLQLSIGHILAIIKNRSLKALGDIGSMAMLTGMYFIVLSLIASNEYRQIPLIMPMVYVFFAGFVLNFIFANYEGNLGRSVLESFKNIISMILGIANIFSDIMSYIRLWAVGLAGAAIASTVNQMAGPMLGHLMFFIFGVVLLCFGHGLNLVLNVLSVLVHGVRLNTLEFSGHAGLAWSGIAYKPFAETDSK